MSKPEHPDLIQPPDDADLIDRHLAGVLTPAEERRLEDLIRRDPDWARRYGEAEELARLMRVAITGSKHTGAPAWAKRSIHARVAAHEMARAPARGWGRRQWLVAACVLCALGVAYLAWPSGGGRDLVQVAYTSEPLPLKDLARSSDVLLLGRTEAVNGRVRFHLETSLYGEPGARACALPDGVGAGEHVALFGRFVGDDVIVLVGDDRGVVHLDGLQRWEGTSLQPAEVRRRLERSADERTAASALQDLRGFLDGPDTLASRDVESGLAFSAPITARYLGRFEEPLIRPTLMRLVMDRDKHPDARSAGAEGLVAADPLGTCRRLLSSILAGPVEGLHAESEDGIVVLRCIDHMRISGGPELAADLRALTERVRCPGLKQRAAVAARAVSGEGPREVTEGEPVHARRIRAEGHELVVLPGCQGKQDGLVVVFRGAADLNALNPLVQRAVGQGLGVLLVPADVRDVQAGLAAAEATDLVRATRLTFVGLGAGAEDAVQAARLRAPDRLVLIGALAPVFERLAQEDGVPAGVTVDAWPLDGGRPASVDVHVHRFEATTLREALSQPRLWSDVLPDR